MSLIDALNRLTSVPLGEQPIEVLLALVDTVTTSVEPLGDAFTVLAARLADEVMFDGRVIDPLTNASSTSSELHGVVSEGAQQAHIFYDGYVTAVNSGVNAPARDVLVATQEN